MVDADDGRVGPGEAPEGAHFDAGAAAQGQDPPGVGQRQPREVGLRPPRVALVGAAELQAGGDGRQHRLVHGWSEAENVAVIPGSGSWGGHVGIQSWRVGHCPAFLIRRYVPQLWVGG